MFLQQPGLLVKTPNSYGGTTDEAVEQGTWINADPIKGCLVCNIGESKWPRFVGYGEMYFDTKESASVWEVWSNGLYKSTLHRVVHRGSNYRCARPFCILTVEQHFSPESTHFSVS